MPPNYTSVYAKLERAEKHFQALDAEVITWLQGGNHKLIVEKGGYGTRIGLAARLSGPPPDLLRWGLITGDCINNLRTSLDHLVYSIAKYESAKNPSADIDSLAFVIVDSPIKFADRNNRKRLHGLSQPVIDAVERVQPYNRPHPHLPPPLRILRDFSNADKHRLLQLAGAGMVTQTIDFVGNPNMGIKSVWMNPDPVQDNDIVCVIESSQPDPNLAIKSVHGGIAVALWHGLRDGDIDPMNARTNYSSLFKILIAEVKLVIAEVSSAVI